MHPKIALLNYTSLYEAMVSTPLAPWLRTLPDQVATALEPSRQGHLSQWLEVLAQLPQLPATQVNLQTPWVGTQADRCPQECQQTITQLLQQLHPWRKGPYTIHGVAIDAEWRSDWKWNRLAPHIQSLKDRLVLDVGCGNGYHCWRMGGEGAKLVIGIDPMVLRVIQFFAIRHFLGHWPIYVLPLGIEAVPPNLQAFDTVFSMGVLYHRRSPLDHLLALHSALRPGGELVLETLVIEGALGEVLLPEGRYARMGNVWFIPTCATLISWLKRCGYENIQCVDVAPTTPLEQRPTAWMRFQSLAEQLNPQDPALTVEGLPAPRRAIFLANRPN